MPIVAMYTLNTTQTTVYDQKREGKVSGVIGILVYQNLSGGMLH
jgi:hypothetical protein